MDYEKIIKQTKLEMAKAITHLTEELSTIRTSRPSASMVENLTVECFSQKFSLKSLAAITLSDKREIILQPWDTSYFEPIERALFNSPLNFSPIVSDDKIIISFPPLTEDLRKKMSRLAGEKGEAAFQTIRHWRKGARREIDQKFADKEMSEDEKYKAREKLDEATKEYNEKIDELVEKKKQEITL